MMVAPGGGVAAPLAVPAGGVGAPLGGGGAPTNGGVAQPQPAVLVQGQVLPSTQINIVFFTFELCLDLVVEINVLFI